MEYSVNRKSSINTLELGDATAASLSGGTIYAERLYRNMPVYALAAANYSTGYPADALTGRWRITRSGQVNATDTLPTASALVAALPNTNLRVGDLWEVPMVVLPGTGQITVQGNTGWTVRGPQVNGNNQFIIPTGGTVETVNYAVFTIQYTAVTPSFTVNLRVLAPFYPYPTRTLASLETDGGTISGTSTISLSVNQIMNGMAYVRYISDAAGITVNLQFPTLTALQTANAPPFFECAFYARVASTAGTNHTLAFLNNTNVECVNWTIIGTNNSTTAIALGAGTNTILRRILLFRFIDGKYLCSIMNA